MEMKGYPLGWTRTLGMEYNVYVEPYPANIEFYENVYRHHMAQGDDVTTEWIKEHAIRIEQSYRFSEQDKAWYVPWKGI